MLCYHILNTHCNRNSLIIPVSEIYACFNRLIPPEGRIKNDKHFGKYMPKTLDDLNISFTNSRKKLSGINNAVMFLEFDNASINKLKNKT